LLLISVVKILELPRNLNFASFEFSSLLTLPNNTSALSRPKQLCHFTLIVASLSVVVISCDVCNTFNGMAGTQPVAVYAMKVPAGDILVPAVPDFAAMFRLSMAALDPSAEPEFQKGDTKKTPRATLKLIRVPADLYEDDDSEDSDYEMEDDEDEGENSSDEDKDEVNGGPSDPSKMKKSSKLDLVKAIAEQDSEEDEDDESDEEAAAKSALMKIMKGKGKAVGAGDEASDDEEDSLELEEVVICTLDPEKVSRFGLGIVHGL
jgi:Nucleoplasmin-like domain